MNSDMIGESEVLTCAGGARPDRSSSPIARAKVATGPPGISAGSNTMSRTASGPNSSSSRRTVAS